MTYAEQMEANYKREKKKEEQRNNVQNNTPQTLEEFLVNGAVVGSGLNPNLIKTEPDQNAKKETATWNAAGATNDKLQAAQNALANMKAGVLQTSTAAANDALKKQAAQNALANMKAGVLQSSIAAQPDKIVTKNDNDRIYTPDKIVTKDLNDRIYPGTKVSNSPGTNTGAGQQTAQTIVNKQTNTQTPAEAAPVQAEVQRPATDPYTASPEVQNALAALNAVLGGQPGAYQQSQPVIDAYNNLMAIANGQPGAYQQSQPVIDAYNALMGLQNNQPGAYAPSQAVLDAQAALANLQSTKPQGYNSKYQPQMNELLQQIMNPGKFNYEFNGDNLFKMYADEYTQRGRQASMDAMGQAAALTGGYGNSYAQQVGNQAYDQYLTQLYDKGLELRDRAYQQFLDEENRKYNQYNLLQSADETDYGRYRDDVNDWRIDRGYYTDLYNTESDRDYNRYRDTVSDWRNDRNFAADMYNTESDRDYDRYRDQVSDWMNNRAYAADRYDTERNYDYNQYRDLMADWMTNRDYATGQYNTLSQQDYSRYADARDMAEKQYEYDESLKENIRQFNESLDWDKMSTQQKYAAQYAMQILSMGQMPSKALLEQAGLSQADAAKMITQLEGGGGGGYTGNGSNPNAGNYSSLYVQGSDGKYYKTDEKGELAHDSNGKLISTTEDKLPSNAGLVQNPNRDVFNELSATKTASEPYKAGNAWKNVMQLYYMYNDKDEEKKNK